MAAGFDFREVRNIQRRLEKLKTAQLAHDMAGEMAARLLRMVKRRTPVQTGNLREKWTASEVSRQGDTYSISVYNNEEYAVYVEFGHRTRNYQKWVPGSFMMTISANELEKGLPRLLQKRMEAFLREAVR